MGKLCNFRLFVGNFIFHFFFNYPHSNPCHCCCYCSHFSSCGERWKRAFFERRVRVRWGWLLMMRFGNPLPYVEDWQVGPRELNDLWIGFYAGWVVCVVLPSPDEHHNNTTVIDDMPDERRVCMVVWMMSWKLLFRWWRIQSIQSLLRGCCIRGEMEATRSVSGYQWIWSMRGVITNSEESESVV